MAASVESCLYITQSQDLECHEVFSKGPQDSAGASLELKTTHCVGYPTTKLAVLSEHSYPEEGPAILDASFLQAGLTRRVSWHVWRMSRLFAAPLFAAPKFLGVDGSGMRT